MAKPDQTSPPDHHRFTQRIRELRSSLTGENPYLLANKSESIYSPLGADRGELQLLLWGKQICISYPDFTIRFAQTHKNTNPMDEALLLYYLTTADGTPMSGRWISFAELPDGRFYNQAFQGYTGRPLAQAFKDDWESFKHSAESLSGVRHSLGNSSFSFQVLPRVPLLTVFWLGDEDFPSSYQVLFDASASHYLPTDAYAILGSTLTRRLIAAKEEQPNQ